jgi:hypothetical protein
MSVNLAQMQREALKPVAVQRSRTSTATPIAVAGSG